MTINKENELIQAAITYFQRCHDEGDFSALQEMGFGPREVRAMASLTQAEKLRLASTKSHFLKIDLNQSVYWRMIDYILRESNLETLIDDLISNGAPLTMVYSLCGIGSRQYHLKRHQFGLPNLSAGRPCNPSEQDAISVWNELENVMRKSRHVGAKEFLDLFRALDQKVSLLDIWQLFKQWSQDGTINKLKQA